MKKRPDATATDRDRFLRRVQLRMRQLELNQQDLAKALGMSQSSISDWFNPRINAVPDGDVMIRLPAVLRCNGHWLLTGEGSPARPGTDQSQQQLRATVADEAFDEVFQAIQKARTAVLKPNHRNRS